MSMISRLQEQSQGFDNYRERGQEAMANFDTDKAITQGTEIAYRHGTALLNQGREQLEAMAGTEIVAGAHMAIPAIVKTGQAISKYRGQVADAQQTQQQTQRLANIRGDTDQKSLPTDSEYGLPDLDGAPSGAPQGYFGQVKASGLKYNQGQLQDTAGNLVSDDRYDTSLQTGSGTRNDPGLRAIRDNLSENPVEPRGQAPTIPNRPQQPDVDMTGRGAQARANEQFRASAPKPPPGDADTGLPDIPGYTDPNVAGARAGASQPGVARPIEPQVTKPSFDPTGPVAGEAPRPTNPQQYPPSRGPAQQTRQPTSLDEPSAGPSSTGGRYADGGGAGEAPPPPSRTAPGGPDYSAPTAPTPAPRSAQSLASTDTAPTAVPRSDLNPTRSIASTAPDYSAPVQGGPGGGGGIPGVNFGGQTTSAPSKNLGGPGNTAVDAGNDTSRLGTPSQGAKNMFGNDTGIPSVPDSQPASALKATATAGAEEGAEVGGVEAVGSVLDAIPGLDILGGILGIAGIAMGASSESHKQANIAPPVKQPVGIPSSGIAFDSAPVFDSSDYHSL